MNHPFNTSSIPDFNGAKVIENPSFEESWKIRLRKKPRWVPLWLYNWLLDRLIYSAFLAELEEE